MKPQKFEDLLPVSDNPTGYPFIYSSQQNSSSSVKVQERKKQAGVLYKNPDAKAISTPKVELLRDILYIFRELNVYMDSENYGLNILGIMKAENDSPDLLMCGIGNGSGYSLLHSGAGFVLMDCAGITEVSLSVNPDNGPLGLFNKEFTLNLEGKTSGEAKNMNNVFVRDSGLTDLQTLQGHVTTKKNGDNTAEILGEIQTLTISIFSLETFNGAQNQSKLHAKITNKVAELKQRVDGLVN